MDSIERSFVFLINIGSLKVSTTKRKIFIDAGIENIRVWIYDWFAKNDSEILTDTIVISNNDDIRKLQGNWCYGVVH